MNRLAALCVRGRWMIVVSTLLLAGVAAVFSAGLSDRLAQGGFDDPGAPSARADAILNADFGGASTNFFVIVDGGGPVGAPATAAFGRRLADRLRSADGIASVQSYWDRPGDSPLRSEDGRLALVTAKLAGTEDDAYHAVPRLRRVVSETPANGVEVQIGGAAVVQSELSETSTRDLERSRTLAFPVTLILLLLVFGSLVAAGLPLVVGVLSVLTAMAVLSVLVELTSVSVFALNITTALGLGLAIDYSLFMVRRFREELTSGRPVPDAVRMTVLTAGRTVMFSAITVALSLSALLIFPMFYLRSFAYGGIAVVLLAGLTAVVVLPAVFAILGERVNRWNLLPFLARRRSSDGRFWERLARLVMRRPVPFATIVTLLLVLLVIPFLHAKFTLADDRALPKDAPAHVAAQTIRDRFADGGTDRIPIVVLGLTGSQAQSPLRDYAIRLSDVAGVMSVEGPTGTYIDGRQAAGPTPSSRRFSSGTDSVLEVTPEHGSSGEDLVHRLRDVAAPAATLVTGDSARLVDTKDSLASRLPLALGLIAIATFVLLFLFTGSLLIPAKAIVLNLLSLTATFGAMVWIFQDGHLTWLIGDPTVTGSLEITTPILMFCVAFGLSMDYELFLLSRIVEEYERTPDTTQAVAAGLARTGGVITAASVLIASVLVTFSFSGITLLKLLGLGLTLAVLMDATLVRGLLVPAVMRLAGRANWWLPSPLRRLHGRIGLHERDPALPHPPLPADRRTEVGSPDADPPT